VVRRFWVVSHHSLVVASYPPCPFPRCAPRCRYRHSTHNPPHEQLLIGLEAGGALLSVVCHLFIVICCRSFVVIRRLSFVVRSSSSVVIRSSSFVVYCTSFVRLRPLYVVHLSLFVVVDWHLSSLPITLQAVARSGRG
jgi:hypothetical protein